MQLKRQQKTVLIKKNSKKNGTIRETIFRDVFDKDNHKQNKHQESPEQEQIKHNFSETTFDTNQDARSYETHEPLHRTKSR